MTTRSGRFEGQVVLVTGASLGVGRACALRFAEEGACVALLARREGPLREAADAIAAPQRTLILPADVADTNALEAAVARTVARFGRLDGVVNNAGAHFRGAFEERDPRELATMVDVNLRAPIVLTRLALPHIRDAGGFVVNVASLAGKVPLDGAVTYSATKWGLRTFSFALAEELRDTPVRVGVVSPGPITTGFILDDLDSVTDITLSQATCTPEHVAEMILATAEDGRRERQFPATGGRLATLAYLWPGLRRWLEPALVRRGKRNKARLKRELS